MNILMTSRHLTLQYHQGCYGVTYFLKHLAAVKIEEILVLTVLPELSELCRMRQFTRETKRSCRNSS